MSHVNHRRRNKAQPRRYAIPTAQPGVHRNRGCGCHPPEHGKQAALGRSAWKRRSSRAIRRAERRSETREPVVPGKFTHDGTRSAMRRQ